MKFNLFEDINTSCSDQLQHIGVQGEAKVVPGGVEVSLSDWNSQTFKILDGLPIKSLDLLKTTMPSIESISGFSLAIINFAGTHISLEDLRCFNLKSLVIDDVHFENQDALSHHNLSHLSACKTSIKDLNFLSNTGLKSIRIDHCQVSDIKALSNQQKLSEMHAFKCSISDLNPIKGAAIETLNISGNPITCLLSLSESPIKNLEIRGTKVESLDPLMETPLESLHLPGSQVSRIAGISNCPIRELNIIGLDLHDFDIIETLPLRTLHVSPQNINSDEIKILHNLEINNLLGPGDPKDQTKDEFFEKYSEIFSS